MADEQKIYVGQTALTIRLDTKIDLTTMSTAVIKYVKPDGTQSEWVAVQYGAATDGVIEYTITSAADIDQDGLWKVWAYIVFNDSTVAPGDTATFLVSIEGY